MKLLVAALPVVTEAIRGSSTKKAKRKGKKRVQKTKERCRKKYV